MVPVPETLEALQIKGWPDDKTQAVPFTTKGMVLTGIDP